MITPAQENERMLARLLGISEDRAAEKLDRRVAITHGDGAATERFAMELAEQLERTIHIGDAGACDLEVVVNADAARSAKERLFIALDESFVSVSAAPVPPSSSNVELHGLQTVIGACYAASAVLARLIDGIEPARKVDPFVIRFGALGANRPLLEKAVTLNDAALVGAGAVANGFLRAARHLRVAGALTVVDPKVVGSGNPNRCLYFDEGDLDSPKAARLCEKAQPDFPDLRLNSVEGTFAQLVKSRGRVRRAIVTADSRPARRSIQKDLPLEVLDASTTDVSEVIVHSHRQPTSGACLACIYRYIPDELARARDIAAGLGVDLADVTAGTLTNDEVAQKIASRHPGLNVGALVGMAFDSLFKQLCGEQALLTPTGVQVLAPFAFVSNLAGALLALELVRFDGGDRFEDGRNYLFVSPWSPPHKYARQYREREKECEFCGQQETKTALAAVWPELGLTATSTAG
jgi:E1 N-terminal domain